MVALEYHVGAKYHLKNTRSLVNKVGARLEPERNGEMQSAPNNGRQAASPDYNFAAETKCGSTAASLEEECI
jgi:hypothetical protein